MVRSTPWGREEDWKCRVELRWLIRLRLAVERVSTDGQGMRWSVAGLSPERKKVTRSVLKTRKPSSRPPTLETFLLHCRLITPLNLSKSRCQGGSRALVTSCLICGRVAALLFVSKRILSARHLLYQDHKRRLSSSSAAAIHRIDKSYLTSVGLFFTGF